VKETQNLIETKANTRFEIIKSQLLHSSSSSSSSNHHDEKDDDDQNRKLLSQEQDEEIQNYKYENEISSSSLSKMRQLNDHDENHNKEELIKIATDFSNEMAQLGF